MCGVPGKQRNCVMVVHEIVWLGAVKKPWRTQVHGDIWVLPDVHVCEWKYLSLGEVCNRKFKQWKVMWHEMFRKSNTSQHWAAMPKYVRHVLSIVIDNNKKMESDLHGWMHFYMNVNMQFKVGRLEMFADKSELCSNQCTQVRWVGLMIDICT